MASDILMICFMLAFCFASFCIGTEFEFRDGGIHLKKQN